MHTYYEATPEVSLSGALISGGTCLQKVKELTMTVEGQRDGSLDTGSTPVYSTFKSRGHDSLLFICSRSKMRERIT